MCCCWGGGGGIEMEEQKRACQEEEKHRRPPVRQCRPLVRRHSSVISERTLVGEEAEAELVRGREGGSREASVCFCAVEGEGQAAVQCSAQLLSKLLFLSVYLLPSLSPLGWAFSACLSTTGSGETSAKQSWLLLQPPRGKAVEGSVQMHAEGYLRIKGNVLLLRT